MSMPQEEKRNSSWISQDSETGGDTAPVIKL